MRNLVSKLKKGLLLFFSYYSWLRNKTIILKSILFGGIFKKIQASKFHQKKILHA